MPEMLASYVAGAWYTAPGEGVVVVDATTGDPVARVSSGGLDTRALGDHTPRGWTCAAPATFMSAPPR